MKIDGDSPGSVTSPPLVGVQMAARTGALMARVGGALPLLGPLALYSYVGRAWWALGRLPAPYDPDPKDLGFALHHAFTGWMLELAIVAPVLLLPLVLVPGSRSQLRWLVIGVLSYAVFWALLIVDPGGLFEWYAD